MAHAHSSRPVPRSRASRAVGINLSVGGPDSGQKEFAAALLDPTLPIPRGLVGPDRQPDVRRFNVYRNNVFVGLIEALEAAYPAVCRIVGNDFFTAMARIHVALEPPRTPVMLEYGESFPAFIDAFEPACSVPYLADVARLERAWVEAYHAAESASIALTALNDVDAHLLPHLGLTLHPSLRVVRSSFPVVELWQMNIDGGTPAAIDIFRGGENALVVRPSAEVEVRRVTPGAATFVQCLAAGKTMAAAASLAQDEDAGFDLARALGDLFAADAVIGWNVQAGSHS